MAEQPPANPPSDQLDNEPGFKPYVGPRTFRPNEGALFFGRDREARDLTARIISERFTLFYAQSGAGKSSLINTRILPGLAAQGFEVLPVARVSGHAGEDLVGAHLRVPPEEDVRPEEGGHEEDGHEGLSLPPPDDGETPTVNIFVYNLLASLHQRDTEPSGLAFMTIAAFLDNLVCHDDHFAYDPTYVWPEDAELKPRVLIIDQFEEILTTNSAYWTQREAFFRQLGEALAADDLLWLVLSLREDFIAGLDPYLHLVNNGVRQRFYMQHLDRNAALDAIRLPVKDARPFEPDAAETLVNNLMAGRGEKDGQPQAAEFVEPVQLQAVCYQMWEKLKAHPGPKITCQNVLDFADVDTALVSFYEDTIAQTVAETGVSELDLRHWFESRLVTEAGTRNMVFRGVDETGGLPTTVADAVRARFIVREVVRPGGVWYELVHDRFIKPIQDSNRRWLQDQPLLQLAQQWQIAGRGETQLLTGDQLAEYEATNWQALGPDVAAYMDASRLQSRKSERRTRLIQGGVGAVLFLGLFVFAVFMYVAARSAESSRDALATGNAQLAQSNATKDANATAAAQANAIIELQVDALSTSQAESEAKSIENEALRLVDAADNYLEQGQFDAAILFGYQAYEKDDAPRVRAVLFDALDSKIDQTNIQTILRGVYPWPVDDAGQPPPLTGLMPGPQPDSMAALSGGQLVTWPLDDAGLPAAQPFPIPAIENRNILAAAFSPAGDWLAVSTGDAFYLWPVDGGAIAPMATVDDSLIIGVDRVSALAFSADGRRLAAVRECVPTACPSRYTIDVWDVVPGDSTGPLHPVRVLSAGAPVKTLAFADASGRELVWSDGLTLAIDSVDSERRVVLPRQSARKAAVTGVAAAPADGLLVATGCFPPERDPNDIISPVESVPSIDLGIQPQPVAPEGAAPATPEPDPTAVTEPQLGQATETRACTSSDEGWVELWFLGSDAPFGRGLSGQLQSPTYLSGRGQFIFTRPPATTTPDSPPATGAGDLPFWLADRDAWPAAACTVAGRNLTAAEWLDFNPGKPLADYAVTCSELPIHPSVVDGLLAQCLAAPAATSDTCWADLERIAGVPVDPAAITAVEDKIAAARDSYARQRRTTTMRHLAEAESLLRAVPEPIARQQAASIRFVSESVCTELFNGVLQTDSPAVAEACRRAGLLDLSTGSVAIEADAAARLWRIDGRAGDTVGLAVTATEGGDATLTLYDEQMIQVDYNDDSDGTFNPRLLTQLPADGAYTVVVNWLGTPGAYVLRAAREQPGELTFGAPVAADATQRLWHLPAEAGDLVMLNLVTDAPGASLQLRDADFQILFDTDNVLDNRVTTLISADGTYLVEVGNSGSPGDYTLTAERLAATPFTPGQSAPGDADSRFWRFDGRAGDVITLAVDAPGSDAKLILYAPDGTVLAENDDDLAGGLNPRLEALLLADGPFIVEVGWVGGEAAVPYTLTSEIRSPEPLPLNGTTTIIGRQFWSLTGQQGDTLTVDARALGGGNGVLRLRDAQFSELTTTNDLGVSLDPYLSSWLPSDGDYYLELDWVGVPDAAEVTATLQPAAPLAVGDVITADDTRRVWRLTGDGPALVTIEGQDGADTWLELYDAEWNLVTYDDTFREGTDPGLVVALSGTPVYVVVGELNNAPFAYTIRATAERTALIIAGEPVSAAPDQRLWTFDGRGGEFVTFLAQGVDGSIPTLYLYDEQFVWLSMGYSPIDSDYSRLTYHLPTDGRVYVEVTGADGYTLSATATVPQELPLQVSTAPELQGWPFLGAAGDVVTVDLLAPTAAFGFLRLIDPQNIELAYVSKDVGQTGAQLVYTLPTDGPYIVEVSGETTLTPYDLTVSSVAPVALPLDVSAPGGEGGQTTWVFAARAGDIIAAAARSLDGGDMLIDLIDAQNLSVAASDDFSDIDPYLLARLPADGAYFLVVDWSDWGAFLESGSSLAPLFGPFRLTAEIMEPQPLALGDDVLTGTPEQRLWRFDGQAGDVVTLSAEATAGSGDQNLWLRLLDTGLIPIAQSDNADGLNPALTAELPAEGEYFIEVGWFGDEGGYRLYTSVE